MKYQQSKIPIRLPTSVYQRYIPCWEELADDNTRNFQSNELLVKSVILLSLDMGETPFDSSSFESRKMASIIALDRSCHLSMGDWISFVTKSRMHYAPETFKMWS